MSKEKLERLEPSEEGRRNDPNLRDESAAQPGVQTMSSGGNDASNEQLTKTTSDQMRQDTEEGSKADKSFDES